MKSAFAYPDLERIDSEAGRFYRTPFGLAPSVTTVLSKSTDKSWIDDWRNRVGRAAADAISKESADLGTKVHFLMETCLSGEEAERPRSTMEKLAAVMARAIAGAMIDHIGDVWGLESRLHFRDLYAGTTDLIALWDGEPAVIDYKTGKNFKDAIGVRTFAMQCAAYGLAHNEMFGTKISKSVVIECTRRADVRITCISGKDFDIACDNWAAALERYHS